MKVDLKEEALADIIACIRSLEDDVVQGKLKETSAFYRALGCVAFWEKQIAREEKK